MNSVQIVGRLTKDVDIRYSDSGSSVARFCVAVDRKYRKDGEAQADFINCLAFGKSAEFVEKYFSKGNRIGLTGRIQTGSYTNKEGQKVYTTDVVVEAMEFVESRRAEASYKESDIDAFMKIPDDVGDEGLPFN